jgi:microcystin-dependent protein
MKTNHRRIFLLAAVLFAPWILQAETAVPDRISYQGIITDMGGNLVGNPDPENRTVIFRIWNHPTASAAENLLYSEEQVATIAKGEFSVLVGGGGALTSEPLGFSETEKGPGTIQIADVFDGDARYLGVTILPEPAVEISPRQQIVTSPFSFRAKQAETVIDLGDQQVTLGKMAAASVNSLTIVNNSIAAEDLGSAAVTNEKLAEASVTLDKLVSAVREALCPPGSIVAFAGATPPNGWLLCDGTALKSSEHPGLHSAIGTAWGNGSSDADPQTNFNLPDLRGVFLRGVNGSRADIYADTASGSRLSEFGGNAGNQVGTYQPQDVQRHAHKWGYYSGSDLFSWNDSGQPVMALDRLASNQIPSGSGKDDDYMDVRNVANGFWTDRSVVLPVADSPTETRPNNVYVNYIIKK